MVKVQNGWETRSIDEVEGLASRLSSPTSPNGYTRRYGMYSPRSEATSTHSRTQEMSVLTSISSRPSTGYTAETLRSVPSQTHYTRLQSGVSLAPAPELRAQRAPRLSHGHGHRPVLSTSSVPSGSIPRTTTPTPREQEAVDSLLFMSSPANTINYKRSAQSTAANHAPSRKDLALPSQQNLQKITQPASSTVRPAEDSTNPDRDVDMLLDEMRRYGTDARGTRGSRAPDYSGKSTIEAPPSKELGNPVVVDT